MERTTRLTHGACPVTDLARQRVNPAIGTQLPRTRRPLPHRPRRLNRSPTFSRTKTIGQALSTLTNDSRHDGHGHAMGISWARTTERMTRFELATLTLARLSSPSVQSVYCAAVPHSPQNRPGNPSVPSGSYTGLPSPNGLGPSELCCATTPGLSFSNRRLCRRALCARGAPLRRDSVSSRSNPTKAHTVRRRHIFTSGQCLSPR